jgi:hypothetical protein
MTDYIGPVISGTGTMSRVWGKEVRQSCAIGTQPPAYHIIQIDLPCLPLIEVINEFPLFSSSPLKWAHVSGILRSQSPLTTFDRIPPARDLQVVCWGLPQSSPCLVLRRLPFRGSHYQRDTANGKVFHLSVNAWIQHQKKWEGRHEHREASSSCPSHSRQKSSKVWKPSRPTKSVCDENISSWGYSSVTDVAATNSKASCCAWYCERRSLIYGDWCTEIGRSFNWARLFLELKPRKRYIVSVPCAPHGLVRILNREEKVRTALTLRAKRVCIYGPQVEINDIFRIKAYFTWVDVKSVARNYEQDAHISAWFSAGCRPVEGFLHVWIILWTKLSRFSRKVFKF